MEKGIEPKPIVKWLIRAWIYLPITLSLGYLTTILAFKNIGIAFFMALAAVGIFEWIRYLEKKFGFGLPTRRRAFLGSTLLSICVFSVVFNDLTDGEKHIWPIVMAVNGVFFALALPFALFLAPNTDFLGSLRPGESRERGS